MDNARIGLKLKELRKDSGKKWGQILSELKEDYGIEVAQSTIYGYENGHASPDVDLFMALCLIYGCDDILYYFGYRSTPMNSKHTPEESELLDRYKQLPDGGKDMIRGALGLEKDGQKKAQNIS